MATATQTSKILSAEQEAKLRQPIDEYVGKIQAQIDELRTDGTEKAVNIQNELDNLKRDRIYTAQEKTERETKLKPIMTATITRRWWPAASRKRYKPSRNIRQL